MLHFLLETCDNILSLSSSVLCSREPCSSGRAHHEANLAVSKKPTATVAHTQVRTFLEDLSQNGYGKNKLIFRKETQIFRKGKLIFGKEKLISRKEQLIFRKEKLICRNEKSISRKEKLILRKEKLQLR